MRLHEAFLVPNAPPVRVLRHRGTCGDDAGAAAIALDALFRDTGVPVMDAACDGACWAAPAATVVRAGHRHRFARLDRGVPPALAACVGGMCDEPQAGTGVGGLTARLGRNDGTLADVLAQGAYAAAAIAARLPATRVVEVARSAGRTVPASAGDTLVVRAHDAPGAVAARHLVEGDPHRLIEGILVAARATGAGRARVCIEDARARAAFERALADASAAGILDGSALTGDPVVIEVTTDDASAGIEPGGDVEALCALTTIFDSPPPPTRLVSLSGDLARFGLVEVPLDGNTTWAGLLATAGVMPARVQALLVGGTSRRLVLPADYDTPLSIDALGDGVVRVLSPDADLGEFEAR